LNIKASCSNDEIASGAYTIFAEQAMTLAKVQGVPPSDRRREEMLISVPVS